MRDSSLPLGFHGSSMPSISCWTTGARRPCIPTWASAYLHHWMHTEFGTCPSCNEYTCSSVTKHDEDCTCTESIPCGHRHILRSLDSLLSRASAAAAGDTTCSSAEVQKVALLLVEQYQWQKSGRFVSRSKCTL